MDDSDTLVKLTADIVAAHVSNNSGAISDIPLVIRSVHEALAGLGVTEPPEVKQEPAVSIRASVKPRSEEHTSELQSLMRISYAVFCLKKKKRITTNN